MRVEKVALRGKRGQPRLFQVYSHLCAQRAKRISFFLRLRRQKYQLLLRAETPPGGSFCRETQAASKHEATLGPFRALTTLAANAFRVDRIKHKLARRMSAVSVTQYLGRSGALTDSSRHALNALAASMIGVCGRGCARRAATSPLFGKGMQLRFANGTQHRVSTAPSSTLGKLGTAIIDHIRGKNRVVEHIDDESGILRYASAITQHRSMSGSKKNTFPEELARALVLVDLVYEKGYAPEDIELEKIVRVNDSDHRVDVIL